MGLEPGKFKISDLQLATLFTASLGQAMMLFAWPISWVAVGKKFDKASGIMS